MIYRLLTQPATAILLGCVAVLTLPPTPALAQMETSISNLPLLTLNDCLTVGLTNASAIANANHDEEIAEQRIRQVKARVYPQLDLRSAYTRIDEVSALNTPAGSFSLGQLDNYSASAEVSQLLYSGGSVRSALRAAGIYREMAAENARLTRATLIRDITLAFLAAQLATAIEQVRASELAQLEQHRDQAQLRFNNHTTSEFELLAARTKAQLAIPPLLDARNNARLARLRLRQILNLQLDFQIPPELQLEPWPCALNELLQIAPQQRPELHIADLRIHLSECDIRAQQADARPSLRLRSAATGSDPAQTFTAEPGWDWHWNVGLSAEWKLWDGWLVQSKVREKQLEKNKAQLARDDLHHAIRIEVEQLYGELTSAAQNVSSAATAVEWAEKGFRIAQTRHEQGLATFLELNDARVSLAAARLQHATAIHNHCAAATKLRFACGIQQPAPQGETSHDE